MIFHWLNIGPFWFHFEATEDNVYFENEFVVAIWLKFINLMNNDILVYYTLVVLNHLFLSREQFFLPKFPSFLVALIFTFIFSRYFPILILHFSNFPTLRTRMFRFYSGWDLHQVLEPSHKTEMAIGAEKLDNEEWEKSGKQTSVWNEYYRNTLEVHINFL